MVKDLSIQLCGITLDNPVIPASGTFGFGLELADSPDLNRLGGIALKGTTREARYGNPLPRIAECEGGLLNSVGLQNPGVKAVIAKSMARIHKSNLVNHGVVPMVFADKADYKDLGPGAGKTLTFDSLPAGVWYVGVECATTVETVETDCGVEYSGHTEVLNGIPYSIQVTWD